MLPLFTQYDILKLTHRLKGNSKVTFRDKSLCRNLPAREQWKVVGYGRLYYGGLKALKVAVDNFFALSYQYKVNVDCTV